MSTTTKSSLEYNVLMGITLKSLRKEKNIPQTALIECAGVSRATWSRIENGQSPIDFTQLTRVVGKCFNLSLNEFFSYMDKLDTKLKETIENQAEEKNMDSSHFLLALGALGVGALIGFLAKTLSDD